MRIRITAIALAQLMAAPIFAAVSTANLNVTASVGASCTITTLAVAFGSYDPVGANLSAPLSGTGTVTVSCTRGAAATIDLGNGSDFGSAARRMSSGSDFLGYGLYKDSARTQVWGSGMAGGTMTSYFALTKGATAFTVYGGVPQGQGESVGRYRRSLLGSNNY